MMFSFSPLNPNHSILPISPPFYLMTIPLPLFPHPFLLSYHHFPIYMAEHFGILEDAVTGEG
jgi:hypothetical protein